MKERLRLALAAIDPPRAARLVRDARAIGHEVRYGAATADELRREAPDVILVGRASGDAQCLSLISLAAHELDCASVVVLDAFDRAFGEEAAERGAFGCCLPHGGISELAVTVAVAHHRHLDHTRLLQAFVRRAAIEQAKGILMNRNGISSDRAFTLLRRQSQRTNHKIIDIAQAVVNSHALLLSPPAIDATDDAMLALLPPHHRASRQHSRASHRP